MELIDKNALSMELTNEVLNVFQGLIDKAPIVEERKQGYWIDVDLDTSICSICKNPQEYETKYCPECGAKMDI